MFIINRHLKILKRNATCKRLRKMSGSNVRAAETGCTGSVLHTENKRDNAL